jgi:hypothetical protein
LLTIAFYLILKVTPLRSSVFFIVAMRTLHQAGAKKGKKASTNETAQDSRSSVRNLIQASTRLQLEVARAQFEKLREMFDDLCDAHELTLARMENSGKNGMTLNESRAKRGLQPL